MAIRKVMELTPIRRFLHVENGFDVLQMIDGKLSVAAPLLFVMRATASDTMRSSLPVA